MLQSRSEYDEIVKRVVSCAIEVHKELRPGLMESIYDVCLQEMLTQGEIKFKRQVSIPVIFKGKQLDKMFVIDYLVEDSIVLELKSVEHLMPVHEAELVS
jgi:GxxExxY protein